jgi:DNA-binding NtrC family response regulator
MEVHVNRPRVLIIGGPSAIRHLVTLVLTNEDCLVTAADNAVIASEILSRGPVHLAVLIPGSGISIHACIRDSHPGIPALLIVEKIPSIPASAQHSRPIAFLERPFTRTQLLDAVYRLTVGTHVGRREDSPPIQAVGLAGRSNA